MVTHSNRLALNLIQHRSTSRANRLAKVVHKLVSPEQSAFISGRQILDGPLMLSEIIDCSKWRGWIRECLYSARTSILVNGSPTAKFYLKRGLRQGDPLSPFLFILVMEGLHIAIEDAVHQQLISGVNRGCSPGILLFTYLGLPIGSSMNYTINVYKGGSRKHSGILANGTLKCKVGDEASVRSWNDMWLGDEPLSIRYSRLFRLDSNEEWSSLMQLMDEVSQLSSLSDGIDWIDNMRKSNVLKERLYVIAATT
nr:RNA-directed DNA polymerase, eukaryota, reverse transcriptase zinc-binding domain protein [Tanacetum cinerariifolium]